MLTSLVACVVVPVLLLCWSSTGSLRHSPWPAVAVVLWYGFGLVHAAAVNVQAPREWDYLCFWLYGHIAAAHQNIYDPAVFARFGLPSVPSSDFRDAVLNVGFPYPPPSIALFFPLGFIHSVPAGLALWYAVQFAALGAAAWIVARALMPAEGWRAALLVLAVIVALPAASMTVNNAQTNFLLLLLVGLALGGRGTAAGAVWTVLAVWIKPYAAALLLLDLIRGNRRRLVAAVAAVLVSVLGALLLLGPSTLASYLRANPSAREPVFAFTEIYNQSLLAVVLRAHAVLPPHVSALHEPVYIAVALILVVVTAGLCARLPATSEVAFASMLLLGLIVYPGALSSYGVVLVVPLLVLWRHRADFPGRAIGVAGLCALAVLLQSARLERGFEANVLVWVACAYLLLVQRGRARVERPMTSGSRATLGVTG